MFALNYNKVILMNLKIDYWQFTVLYRGINNKMKVKMYTREYEMVKSKERYQDWQQQCNNTHNFGKRKKCQQKLHA